MSDLIGQQVYVPKTAMYVLGSQANPQEHKKVIPECLANKIYTVDGDVGELRLEGAKFEGDSVYVWPDTVFKVGDMVVTVEGVGRSLLGIVASDSWVGVDWEVMGFGVKRDICYVDAINQVDNLRTELVASSLVLKSEFDKANKKVAAKSAAKKEGKSMLYTLKMKGKTNLKDGRHGIPGIGSLFVAGDELLLVSESEYDYTFDSFTGKSFTTDSGEHVTKAMVEVAVGDLVRFKKGSEFETFGSSTGDTIRGYASYVFKVIACLGDELVAVPQDGTYNIIRISKDAVECKVEVES